MSVIPPESFTPWSQLEGRFCKKAAEEARAEGDEETAQAIEAIDSRVTILTEGKLPGK